MQQRDYFIRIIEEFMAAVARFLEKAEGKRNDDELRDLYRQYVGDYELLRNMTVEEAIGYAHEQWAEGQRMQKLEMLAELLYAEGSYKQQPLSRDVARQGFPPLRLCGWSQQRLLNRPQAADRRDTGDDSPRNTKIDYGEH